MHELFRVHALLKSGIWEANFFKLALLTHPESIGYYITSYGNAKIIPAHSAIAAGQESKPLLGICTYTKATLPMWIYVELSCVSVFFTNLV